jgi:hypothetical protein
MRADRSEPPVSLDDLLMQSLRPGEFLILARMRALSFGSVYVQIQDGVPVFLEVCEKIKLA